MNENITLISLLAVLVGAFVACNYLGKKKEGYEDVFYAKDNSQNNWVSRPNFKANLSPRFDSTRVGGGYITGSFPGMEVQGAPVTPVEGYSNTVVSRESYTDPNYVTMGGGYGNVKLPNGGLTTQQVNKILADKFGHNPTEYIEPKQLLPVPDMKQTLTKDPSNYQNFMYDRYLFAPLKRRYGDVPVDFIRGDLPIRPLYTGWFDIRSPQSIDLTQGYFSNYLDIQQATSIEDAIYSRPPTTTEQIDPWGQIERKTVYSLV